MANDIKITSSLEAVINDSKTVGAKSYTIKDVDKNVGNSGGSYTQSYTAADAVKYSGVVSATDFTAIASAFESVTTVGTAPDKVKALSLKVDSQTGTARTVDLEITTPSASVTNTGNVTFTAAEWTSGGGGGSPSGSSTVSKSIVASQSLPIVIARISSGESCVIPLSDSAGAGLLVANIKIKDAGYVNTDAESTVTAILIGG